MNALRYWNVKRGKGNLGILKAHVTENAMNHVEK